MPKVFRTWRARPEGFSSFKCPGCGKREDYLERVVVRTVTRTNVIDVAKIKDGKLTFKFNNDGGSYNWDDMKEELLYYRCGCCHQVAMTDEELIKFLKLKE